MLNTVSVVSCVLCAMYVHVYTPLANNLHTFYSTIKMRWEKELIQFRVSCWKERAQIMGGMRKNSMVERRKIVSAEMKNEQKKIGKALLSTARYWRIAAVISFKVFGTHRIIPYTHARKAVLLTASAYFGR